MPDHTKALEYARQTINVLAHRTPNELEAKGLSHDLSLAQAYLDIHQRMQWQPIESAPRDGTFVLCVESSGYIHILQWGPTGKYADSPKWRGDLYDIVEWEPTHWMPLPKPPTESQ